MKKIVQVVSLVVLLVFVVGGCTPKNVAAEINGKKITKEEYTERLENQKSVLTTQGYDFTSEQGKQMVKLLEEQIINEMIQEVVLIQEAEKLSLKIDDKTAEEEIANFKKTYGEEQFKQILEQQKTTEEKLKKTIATQILADEYYKKLTEKITVNDNEVKEYFEKNKKELTKMKVRHIIIESPQDAKPEEDKKAKEKAQSIIKKLENGADFVELAKKESDESAAKESGGALNDYIRLKDQAYDPLFVEGALKIEKDSFNKEPIKSSFGYHIIKVEDKIDDYNSLKDELKEEIIVEKKNKAFQDSFSKAMDNAKIKNYIVPKKENK